MTRERFRVLVDKSTQQADAVIAPKLERMLRLRLNTFVDAIKQGANASEANQAAQIAHDLAMAELRQHLAGQLIVDAYNLAEGLVGKSMHAIAYAAKATVTVAPDLLGSDELLLRKLAIPVADYISATSTLESDTTAKEFERLYEEALLTTDDLSAIGKIVKNIQLNGLAKTKSRAQLMARTLTIWAYNEGAVESYKDAGVAAVEWLTTFDEVTGEWDKALDGAKTLVGTPFVTAGETFVGAKGKTYTAKFDIYHGPLHPNCRCSVAPVL